MLLVHWILADVRNRLRIQLVKTGHFAFGYPNVMTQWMKDLPASDFFPH